MQAQRPVHIALPPWGSSTRLDRAQRKTVVPRLPGRDVLQVHRRPGPLPGGDHQLLRVHRDLPAAAARLDDLRLLPPGQPRSPGPCSTRHCAPSRSSATSSAGPERIQGSKVSIVVGVLAALYGSHGARAGSAERAQRRLVGAAQQAAQPDAAPAQEPGPPAIAGISVLAISVAVDPRRDTEVFGRRLASTYKWPIRLLTVLLNGCCSPRCSGWPPPGDTTSGVPHPGAVHRRRALAGAPEGRDHLHHQRHRPRRTG